MPGGLLQLVSVGAQNEIVNGNPQLTHFHTTFHRHTNFAMEQIRMTFTAANLELSATGTRTMSCRIDRYAQLLHDTYLVFTLPDIWSPLVNLGISTPPAGYDARANAIGYEFQWVKNIGHALIDRVELVSNGQIIQSLRGEWLSLYSHMIHDKNKRNVVDQLIGHDPAMYDPANAFGRKGQYPHSVKSLSSDSVVPNTTVPEPSIRARQLVIPLHFWFCENPGLALPLGALQNSEVYINVTYRALTEIYTIIDTVPSSPSYGTRIRPAANMLTKFLSPPNLDGTQSNPALTTFFPDPYLEGNFIYLTEMEMNKFSRSDQAVLLRGIQYFPKEGQYGGNSDLELPLQNLVTRIVYMAQRSDKIATNDWTNYTNWSDPSTPPFTPMRSDTYSLLNSAQTQTFLYSSGQQQIESTYPRDSIVDTTILLDGSERLATKPASFWSLLQQYRHTTGDVPDTLPGVHSYSFALAHDQYQPSGALNGSKFNAITLRITLLQPLPASTNIPGTSQTPICIVRSTAFSPNPVVVPLTQQGTYKSHELLTVVPAPTGNVTYTYTYTLKAYVESINVLRIVNGTMSFVFAT